MDNLAYIIVGAVTAVCLCAICVYGLRRDPSRRSHPKKKTTRDPLDAMETAQPVHAASFHMHDNIMRFSPTLGRVLSRGASKLGGGLAKQDSSGFGLGDSTTEISIDPALDPGAPVDRFSVSEKRRVNGGGVIPALIRKLSSNPKAERAAAKAALEEEQDEDEEAEAAAGRGRRALDASSSGEEGEEGDGTFEWWFYVDKEGRTVGPCTASEMRGLYLRGALGHGTMVRWLPVSYSRPALEEQPADGFSPLQELCADAGPPFMDAPAESKAGCHSSRPGRKQRGKGFRQHAEVDVKAAERDKASAARDKARDQAAAAAAAAMEAQKEAAREAAEAVAARAAEEAAKAAEAARA